MANPKEPQSYGSQADWVAGNVDEEVKGAGERAIPAGESSQRNVSSQHGGAKRKGYFRDRDYK